MNQLKSFGIRTDNHSRNMTRVVGEINGQYIKFNSVDEMRKYPYNDTDKVGLFVALGGRGQRYIDNPTDARSTKLITNKGMEHYDNRRIIRDRSKNMAWSHGTESLGYGGETKKRVLMNPTEFLHRQYYQSPAPRQGISYDTWKSFASVKGRHVIEPMKEAIKDPNQTVPTPIEFYYASGKKNPFQEGRHRGVAAEELGLKQMPVILAKEPGSASLEKDSEWTHDINTYPEDNSVNRRLNLIHNFGRRY